MKLLIFFVVIGVSQAFVFDTIFGGGCKTDADCSSGCCISGTLNNHCSSHYLKFLDRCHLSGTETSNCGCGAGLYCEMYENIGGVAIEHPQTSIYGLCEHNKNMTMVTTTAST